jgi:transposase-like protein
MISLAHFNSLAQIFRYFSDNATCLQFLEEQIYPDGMVACPYCGGMHPYRRGDGRFKCRECGSSFSILQETIFQDTKLPLYKWFGAIFLMSTHSKGISSKQAAIDLGVCQKTAWFMLHKIRTAFEQSTPILEDEVEVDETYVGGRETNKHECKKVEGTQGRSTKTKTPVFGIAQREGDVFALKVEDTKSSTLMPIIKRHVKAGSTVYTDETNIYCNLNENGYDRQIVNHKQKEFAVGRKSTNTIEGFWGQFKRMVYGTYHYVSRRYMQRYIDEAVFRYNNRTLKGGERFAALMENALNVVTFRDVKAVRYAA